MMDAEIGQCRGYFQRWFFSTMKAMCVPFVYSGCRGNRNNFLTEQDCHRTCSAVRDALLEGDRPANVSLPLVRAITGPPVDCVMSPWSQFTSCSVTCGTGFREKTRTVLVEPKNGGQACPRTVTRRRRCHIPPEYCH
ncbi:Spondin-1 [Homalodisca vitripennis]|nr:Spondin-1 [Homalodisca vitripennis]